MRDSSISVTILNYRRRVELIRTLESIRTQTLAPRDVVVVDNGSEDGVADFLRTDYPEVCLVALSGNAGCGGRNHAVNAASGDIAVMLDNDVHLDSPFELQKVVTAFQDRPDVGCFAFKVLEDASGRVHMRDWCHPRNPQKFSDSEFETCFIPEGACAFRRKDYLALGGYYEPYWIGCEGWDLALRMLDAGMKIVYRPQVRVRHAMSGEARSSWRPYYYYTRNYFWIVIRNYGLVRGALYLVARLGMMFYFGLRAWQLGSVLRGIRDGVIGLPSVWKTRRRLSPRAWRELRALNRLRPGLVARLSKHWEKPLI